MPSTTNPLRNTLPPIRVAPGGRYFETFDGEPFLFLGPNDALPWPGLNGLFRRRDLASAERHLQALAENGVTVIRVMLEYCHREHRYFESPVGRFAPNMVALWDDLFGLCERYGVRVLLAPWDNFWMSRRWHKHPYNGVNGGPAEGPHSFFTDEATIQAAIGRLRFVVERWGGSGVLAAWDLFNEIHPYWGGTVAEQAGVIERIGAAVREHELRCHGFTRPQTVSIFGPDPGDYGDLIFRGAGLDFCTTHIYQGAIDYPEDTVRPALVMGEWTRFGLVNTPAGRPFTDTEHGPIHLFNDHRVYKPEPFDDEYERRLMWAHLASGGAGGGMRWPARHPHVVTEGMLRGTKGLAEFARRVDWRRFSPSDARADLSLSGAGENKFHVFAVRDGEQAVAFLLRGVPQGHQGTAPARPPLREVTLELRGMTPGAYEVTIWDVPAGCEAVRQTGCVPVPGQPLAIRLPAIGDETALAVRHVPEEPC